MNFDEEKLKEIILNLEKLKIEDVFLKLDDCLKYSYFIMKNSNNRIIKYEDWKYFAPNKCRLRFRREDSKSDFDITLFKFMEKLKKGIWLLRDDRKYKRIKLTL